MAQRLSWASALYILALVSLALLPQVSASLFKPHLWYCKCECFDKEAQFIPLHRPADPAKPCLTCTRQFCLDQGLAVCKGAQVPELDTDIGTGTEGDVAATCFKREFPRDQVIVTCFLLVCCSLFLYAAVRSKLRKAIETRGQPTDLRSWGEAMLPAPWAQTILGRSPRGHEMRSGMYAPVSSGANP